VGVLSPCNLNYNNNNYTRKVKKNIKCISSEMEKILINFKRSN